MGHMIKTNIFYISALLLGLTSCAQKPATKQVAPRMARVVEPPIIEHLPPRFVGIVITNPCSGDAEVMASTSVFVPLSRKSNVSFTHLLLGNLSNGQPMFLMEITTPSSATIGVEQSSDLQNWQSTGCLTNEPYWHSNEWGQVLLVFPADATAKFFRVTTDSP